MVWLQFDLQAGHRLAVVFSPASYNGRTHLMLCCPMTAQIKGYPFEVLLPGNPPAAVLADQVKSLDWHARKARCKGQVTPAQLSEIRRKAATLIGDFGP